MLRIVLVSLSLLSCTVQAVDRDAVLAKCPKEPEVVGTFYNNGQRCVRDTQTVERRVVEPSCPQEGYSLKGSWCKKRLHHKQLPTCPSGYQLYQLKGFPAECHSSCPDASYRPQKGKCVLPRATLSNTFMTCPADMHRSGAYCCKGDNCPRQECRIGDHVPGKFYYNPETKLCERQGESLVRLSSPKLAPKKKNNKRQTCPAGTMLVRGVCQKPCPKGFRTSKGKCVLAYCRFDTIHDVFIQCPEGSYGAPQSLL